MTAVIVMHDGSDGVDGAAGMMMTLDQAFVGHATWFARQVLSSICAADFVAFCPSSDVALTNQGNL